MKRASSAYIHFTTDFRKKLKEKCEKKGDPLPKANEVAKMAGEAWKGLSDEDKTPYNIKAQERQRSLHERGKQEFCAEPSSELNYSFLGSSSWPPPQNRSVSGANVMSRDIFLLGKEKIVSREFKLFQPQ